jgi:hypothetical protein
MFRQGCDEQGKRPFSLASRACALDTCRSWTTYACSPYPNKASSTGIHTRYSILDTRYSGQASGPSELSIVSLVMRISLTPNLRCLRLGWNHSCEIGLHSTIRLLVVAAIASCALKDVSAPRLPKKLWVGPGTYILHRAHIIVTLLHSVRIMPFRLYTC